MWLLVWLLCFWSSFRAQVLHAKRDKQQQQRNNNGNNQNQIICNTPDQAKSKTSSQSCYVMFSVVGCFFRFFYVFVFFWVGCRSWPSSCPPPHPRHTRNHNNNLQVHQVARNEMRSATAAAAGKVEAQKKTKGSTKLNNNKSAQDSSHLKVRSWTNSADHRHKAGSVIILIENEGFNREVKGSIYHILFQLFIFQNQCNLVFK